MKTARPGDELAALGTMDPHERIEAMARVMRAAFGRPRPLREISPLLGLSTDRVRQIERRALRHLANRLTR